MIEVRRLSAVCGLLALAAFLSVSAFSEAGKGKDLKDWRKGDGLARPALEVGGPPDDATTRFTGQPVVTHDLGKGASLVAWQLQPKLPEAKAAPRDVLVLVDTSASKAKGPL